MFKIFTKVLISYTLLQDFRYMRGLVIITLIFLLLNKVKKKCIYYILSKKYRVFAYAKQLTLEYRIILQG